MNQAAMSQPSGLPHAIGAYVIWGLFPLYLLLLKSVPAVEFVGWRIALTLPVCIAIVLATRQGVALFTALRDLRTLAWLTISAVLIGSNWLIYTVAIQSNHVFAASLGYYINPLANVLAGTLFLGERLSRTQWVAVALATAGVLPLAWGATEMLGIALGLAITFAGYGLARRAAPVGALLGLTIESLLLAVPALAILWWYAGTTAGLSFGQGGEVDMLLALSGVLTSGPLLLFATAARRMDYSTLGFVQYIAPTLVLLIGLFAFHEPLRTIQLACFVTIWIAIAVFSWDLWSRRVRA